MVVVQGAVWWASLPDPVGSAPGFRRPVLVVQGDSFNASKIATVVVVPLTGNLARSTAPGNVLLRAGNAGLPKDSVANVSQIITLDRSQLQEQAGRVGAVDLQLVLRGIDLVLGRH